MKKDVLMHCKHCQVCAKQKVEKTKYIKDNFRPGSMPMELISMDLVGRLSKTSSGHECSPHHYMYVDRLHVLHPS